jgi:hypothetical protein
VTQKLVAQGMTVIAISSSAEAAAGLDGDAKVGVGDYRGFCAIGGTAGQATRITAATGGQHVARLAVSPSVETIIALIHSALRLVVTGEIAPLVRAIAPVEGYGPLPRDRAHRLTFEVQLAGPEPAPETQHVVTGTLAVVADGVAVAQEDVHITLQPATNVIYPRTTILGETSSNGYLYVAMKGNASGAQPLYICSTTDGVNFGPCQRLSNYPLNTTSPALAVFNNQLYVALTDERNSNNLVLGSSASPSASKPIQGTLRFGAGADERAISERARFRWRYRRTLAGRRACRSSVLARRQSPLDSSTA